MGSWPDGDLTVVKCGGTAEVDLPGVCAGLAATVADGNTIVLVHGGSGEAARLAGRLGIRLREMRSADGATSRHTDADALEVLMLAWSGCVKPALVAGLGRAGVPSVGLTGLDGGLLQARRHPAQRALVDGRPMVVRDDHSGRITSVRPEVLHAVLGAGLTPVVSPPAAGQDGSPVNVNADRVAAAIAIRLRARRLVLLTGAPGVLADHRDPGSVLASYRPPGNGERDQAVAGGMVVKVAAARTAVIGGVPEVRIGDGRHFDGVRQAMSGAGGTRIWLTGEAETR